MSTPETIPLTLRNMNYEVRFIKNPRTILTVKSLNEEVKEIFSSLPDDEKQILEESSKELDLLFHTQILLDYCSDLSFKTSQEQIEMLFAIFTATKNTHVKTIEQGNLEKIEKYFNTEYLTKYLLKHTFLSKQR